MQRFTTELGKRRLDELKPANVKDFYNGLTAEGLALQTVRQVHTSLRKALNDPLGLGLVTRNVTDGTSSPRVSHEERAWYTDQKLARLFGSTSGDRFHALWVVLGTLGLRLREALGLKARGPNVGA